MLRREFLGLLALGCGEDMASYPSSPNKYPSTPNKYPVTPKAYPASGSAAYPSGLSSPPTVGSLLVWLNADATTDTGNGTAVTAATDRSPAACSIVEGTSTNGPLRLDASGRRSKRLLSFTGARWLKTLNSTLSALRTGVAKDFSLVWVWQPTNVTLTYMSGWGLTSNFNNYFMPRFTPGGNLQLEAMRSDPTNSFGTSALDTTPKGFAPQVMVLTHDAAAHTTQLYIDGTAIGSPVSFPWAAGASSDNYTWGALLTTSASVSSFMRIRHQLVYSKKLSTTELQQVADWGATEISTATSGLRWKRGMTGSSTFGNGSNATLVICCIGASQGTPYHTTTSYTSIYAGTSQQAYCLFPDGNLGPIDSTVAMTTDPTDATSMVQDSGASAGGVADPWIRMVDYLRAHGETRNIIIVNRCLGSTTSLSWSSGLASSPLAANGAYGSACYYLDEALKAPNAELMFCVAQSESNSAEPPFNSATVANWSTGGWTDTLNALATRYSAFFSKTQRFMIGRQCVTPAPGWDGHWAEMRTAIATFVAGRSDCIMVDYPDGPWDAATLHLETGSNSPGAETGKMGMGVGFGAAIRAAV